MVPENAGLWALCAWVKAFPLGVCQSRKIRNQRPSIISSSSSHVWVLLLTVVEYKECGSDWRDFEGEMNVGALQLRRTFPQSDINLNSMEEAEEEGEKDKEESI